MLPVKLKKIDTKYTYTVDSFNELQRSVSMRCSHGKWADSTEKEIQSCISSEQENDLNGWPLKGFERLRGFVSFSMIVVVLFHTIIGSLYIK